MIRAFLRNFIKPTLNFYHAGLENNPDIKGKSPALVEAIEDDMFLELYLGDSYQGKNQYVTAVIAVYKGIRTFRFKYDSGRLMDDGLQGMAEDCLHHIKYGWDIKEWRKWANDTFNAEIGALERFVWPL